MDMARVFREKTGEFVDKFPEGLTVLETPESREYLKQRFVRLVDKERWEKHDLLELASIFFMMAVTMEEPKQ
jgi:hypothetical protein